MRCDVILCGVGGQGVLSLAGIVGEAARRQGLQVAQGEIHGMSQRGGAVEATLRLSDGDLASPRIPDGSADLLLSLEPLEALRHVHRLAPSAHVVTASEPFDNLASYPDLDEVHARLDALPRVRRIEAAGPAREAGAAKAANVVVLGAALDLLPLDVQAVIAVLEELFAPRGERVMEANRAALQAGRDAAGATPAKEGLGASSRRA